MWKKTKSQSFSLVSRYIQHFNEVSGNKSATRRKSKTAGVIITQYEAVLPEGKSTPDFEFRPVPVTVQEGKVAVFRAIVRGDPHPQVTWKRAKGDISDKDKYKIKHEESTGECRLEIHKVSAEDADTYKCSAENTFGKAVCNTTLTVADDVTEPTDFRKLLKRSKPDQVDGEASETFWAAMLNADRRDYERICSEFGVTDLYMVLKKLEEKRREKMQEKCQDGTTPHQEDSTVNHSLNSVGRTNNINLKSLIQENTGLSQVSAEQLKLLESAINKGDTEELRLLLTQSKASAADFIVKIQEIKAEEREDALFECVLTHPLPSITWTGKDGALENGEKYNITVTENKLIHRLLIKDCDPRDKGIYSAVAGGTSCGAWLVVEDDGDPAKPRKRTVAGGAGIDLEKVAEQQELKNQLEMRKILEVVQAKYEEGKVKGGDKVSGDGRDGEISAGTGRGGGEEESTNAQSEQPGGKGRAKKEKKKRQDGKASKSDGSRSGSKKTKVKADGQGSETSGQVDVDKVTAADEEEYSDESDELSENTDDPESKHQDEEGQSEVTDSHGNIIKSGKRAKGKRKVHWKQETTDSNEPLSEYEESESEEDEDCTGEEKSRHHPEEKQQLANKEKETSEGEKMENGTNSTKRKKRKRRVPLIDDVVIDPGVQFICGLSDVSAIINEAAEFTCKLSSDDCQGVWFRDGKKISPDENFIITKDGAIQKLTIIRCAEEHSGKYRFEADGRKTEAMISVKDPPRFVPGDLSDFTEPVIVKVGHSAIFKLHFLGHEPIKIQWYREGDELQVDGNTKIERFPNHSRLLLSRCQRKETGEIKIKLKNEHGFAEAFSQLVVLDKPTPPLGPVEVMENSRICIEFGWRPPKDDGGSPVINYLIERQQVGRNTWKKKGEIPGVPTFRDTEVEHGRRYCYRVRAVTAEGTSDVMETEDMQAGTLAFPGPPAPPKVVSAFDDCIHLCWLSPINTGGSRILGYILEKRKKGSNLWTVVNALDELIKEKKYSVKDVVAGMEYEFRVSAINLSGVGEFSNPSEFVFARDPKQPPGKVPGLKVTETSYSHMVLTWTKPEDVPGIQDEAKGYFIETRRADCIEWSRCISTPMIMTSFTVKGLKSMEMYWVRVIATNDGGEGEPQELDHYVMAMPSPVRPKFTNLKMKSFVVVRAGNSVRITVPFEASPRPNIMWLKDNVPVTKRATVSNSDESSQLLIPSSERTDSGIYSILVKNLVGQETFSTEIRVTDDPKPPGLVELEENVPDTLTVMWEPSPDEKRDDRLHYIVTKLDTSKGSWATVADRLFNNKVTVCNIMAGREYHFRVYAKNDIGVSAPAESPTWGTEKKKEKFQWNSPIMKSCDLRCAPTFIVPLKLHSAPKGYECYMSCAVSGDPPPRVTWYRNHISLNTNTNYHISNTCGVCSMMILHVGPKDVGEYSVTAENQLGRAETSTLLSIRE